MIKRRNGEILEALIHLSFNASLLMINLLEDSSDDILDRNSKVVQENAECVRRAVTTKREEQDQAWYVYDRTAINDYQVRGIMRVRDKNEPTDTALGITIQGDGGSLVLSYEEAKVIRRHLNSALTRMERTLKQQNDQWEQEMQDEGSSLFFNKMPEF